MSKLIPNKYPTNTLILKKCNMSKYNTVSHTIR